MNQETVASPSSSSGLYTRQATGLVREIGLGPSVALNMSYGSLPFLVLVATLGPASFPGASPFWAIIFTAVICIFPVLMYGMFVSLMPRSGGDYVFVSRTINPWVGFATNFNLTLWFVLYVAYYAYLIPTFGLASAFSTIGVAADSQTMVDWSAAMYEKGWIFAIGVVCLVLVGLLMSVRLATVLKAFVWVFWVSLAGAILVPVILLLLNGREDFIADVARFGGDYNKIIADAKDAGYTGGGSFDFKNTLLATCLAFGYFAYVIVAPYVGGEVRSPKRTAMYSMLIALGAGAVMGGVMMALAQTTFGTEFLGAATYLSNMGDENYPFGAPSFFFMFVSMLTTSTPVIVIISLSFIVGILITLPAVYLVATRNIFAWSFDRIMPAKLSEVSPRTHTPLIANWVILVITVAFFAYLVFGDSDFLSIFLTTILAELLSFFVIAVAGIILPFRRSELYKTSSWSKKPILGIPVLTLVSVLALAVYALFFYALATTDALGANQGTGVWAAVIIAAISIAIYPIAYYVNKSRGIDLSLSFKELPPE
jgi:basic amino acid/polyamine antiporter, APA family